MIYLIAPRIKVAENAAHFLNLPRGTWRFATEVEHLRTKNPEPGDIFIHVYSRNYELTSDDIARRDALRAFLKDHHIQVVSYTSP